MRIPFTRLRIEADKLADPEFSTRRLEHPSREFDSAHGAREQGNVTRYESFVLTELGKEKVGGWAVEGRPQKVLHAISERGGMNASEISQHSGINLPTVMAILDELVALQWISTR